jgi:hypothetical protein
MWKWLMNLKHEHQNTYDKTFFYMTYRISFLHKCHTEKFTVQVYILTSVFSTVKMSCGKV